MKKSLFCLAICFSAALIFGQSRNLEFFFSDSGQVRSRQNYLQYSLTPFKNALVSIRGISSSEERLNFDQENQRSSLELDLAFQRRIWRHSFQSGYEYLYDHSNLEQDLFPYVNKTGFMGYALNLEPLDSLSFELGGKGYIRREEDRYLLGNTLGSDGFLAYGRTRYALDLGSTSLGLSTGLETKRLDWEYYENLGFSALLNHYRQSFAAQNNFLFNHHRDKLFQLGSDGQRGVYTIYDTQTRKVLSYTGNFELSPADWLNVRAQEYYGHTSTDLKQNIVRTNADYVNQATLNLDADLSSNLLWQNRIDHNYAIKDFNYSRNTRHIENRNLFSNLAWEYGIGDSLSLGASVELQRTSFPDDNHNWDNDLRTITLRAGNVHYWKQRIKLSNRISWNQTDDVYIKGILSSNNKRVQSLGYNPSCAILIGDRIVFNQSYTIRADYTDYTYEGKNKALYRQLGYTYNIRFDSFPLIARSGDLNWMNLPYRPSSGNAFLADLAIGYEENQYADYLSGYYSIDFKNIRNSATLTLKHDIQDFYYIVQPRYSWGTWKEYNLLCGFAWQFNDNSLLEFSLNPLGESLDDLDWRSTANLSIHF